MAILTKNLESLSAQQLVDCAGADIGIPFGCTGGILREAIQYVKSQGGIDPDVSYPYEEQVHTSAYLFKILG